MPIVIHCPSCKRQLRVPDQYLGKRVKCPECATTFQAATEEEQPSQPVAERPPPRPAAAQIPQPAPPDDEDQDYELAEEDTGAEEVEDYEEERRPRRRRRRYLEAHRGATILTLGILSLLICGPILGPIAWTMGNADLQKMRQGIMDRSGEGNTNAGRICGIIATILSVAGCVIYGLIFVLAAGAGMRQPMR